MPREIILGNGRLLVNLDSRYRVRELYYPYVGKENHLLDGIGEVGVWVEGNFSWVGEAGWEIGSRYEEETLVAVTVAFNPALQLSLRFIEAVDWEREVWVRKVEVKNLASYSREIRVFFYHDFNLGGYDLGDTAFYDPATRGMVHYKSCYFLLLNGHEGIDRYSIRKRGGGGSRADAEDGELAGPPADQGDMNSAVAFSFYLEAGGEKTFFFWLVAGRSLEEVREKDGWVKHKGPDEILERTRLFWRHWLKRTRRKDFADLPEDLIRLYRHSLLVLRAQTDLRGGVLAASDTDILATNRDHYAYIWPRDGALVAHALDRAGYPEVSRAFFNFAASVLRQGEGFFWHKYHPDGTLGSSWLAWLHGGEEKLPIQEDETALVLWALGEHLRLYPEASGYLTDWFSSLVKPMASFLACYRDEKTGLPLPSYDLWEERYGTFTFTASTVYAALRAAAYLAILAGERLLARTWKQAAEEVKQGVLEHLYDRERNRFLRGLGLTARGLSPDPTLDASLWGVWRFGLLPPSDPRVVATMEAVEEGLKVKTAVGGIARYHGDYYFRQTENFDTVPGNPWIITTLWLAEYLTVRANRKEELAPAKELLCWAARHKSSTGMLPEQLHPFTGTPLSVCPLTWSHAAFIEAVEAYRRGWRAFPS
ncbi:glycoside hydrolase 15-related protein [Ammonifex degensii KC4]|uniref:Glycoside hydrolase 15-related protein n=1 Tax=Ammonifex degensii (strain DSM 10501 / KC4) TaxID=429009 RepID=C9RBF7_AMMDK|nr:glycoside hydrolase family 15 protein [Ammonifex degensii]ACX51584.1 glycoside hydrolase 15-related protein [Ammonifex degensii KC4]